MVHFWLRLLISQQVLLISTLILSLTLTSTLSNSSTITSAFPIETTARKRLGKKSFIHRQELGRQQKIATPDEIKDIVSKNSVRKVGSSYYLKAWRHWEVLAIESIRFDLSNNLPHPTNKEKFENLFFRLGVAADKGEMPSFSHAGARSGYALEFFGRARNIADLFIDTVNPSYPMPDQWTKAMLDTPILGGDNSSVDGNKKSFNMISLGGGPGFDFVGAAMAATFTSSGKKVTTPIHATILDYEEGWSDLVDAMDMSTMNILNQENLSCDWGGKCDITKPINDPGNNVCLEEINSTNLWTCQYCVAENANLLRASNYVFFKDLFQLAPEGTLFILTEVTPRIWPDICNVIEKHCKKYMEVSFNKNGRQMLIRKGDEQENRIMMSDRDAKKLEKFSTIVECHDKKLLSGWERQQQKIRGSTQ